MFSFSLIISGGLLLSGNTKRRIDHFISAEYSSEPVNPINAVLIIFLSSVIARNPFSLPANRE